MCLSSNRKYFSIHPAYEQIALQDSKPDIFTGTIFTYSH